MRVTDTFWEWPSRGMRPCPAFEIRMDWNSL